MTLEKDARANDVARSKDVLDQGRTKGGMASCGWTRGREGIAGGREGGGDGHGTGCFGEDGRAGEGGREGRGKGG